MTTRLVAGRIGGVPVQGGYVSLEKAEMAQVLDSATGLLRETVGSGAKLAVAGGVMMLLLSSLAKAERAKQAKEQDRLENPPKSLAGICYAKNHVMGFYGICLNQFISFSHDTYGSKKQTVALQNIVAIESESHVFSDQDVRIELIDGSYFERANVTTPLEFMTIAGLIELHPHDCNFADIKGLNNKKISAYRNKLIEGLHQTRVELLNQIGLDLVQKYFHIEDAMVIDVAPVLPPPVEIPVSMVSMAPVCPLPVPDTQSWSTATKMALTLALMMPFAVGGTLMGILMFYLYASAHAH